MEPLSSASASLAGRRADRRPWTWWVAWVTAGVALALLPPTFFLAILNRDAPDVWTIVEPQTIVGAIAFSLVGAFLASRRPANPIGWIFLIMGLFLQVSGLAGHWAIYGLATNPGVDGAGLALRLSLGLAATVLVPNLSLLLFPSGRFLNWWTALVGIVSVVASAVLGLLLFTSEFVPPGFPEMYERAENPIGSTDPIFDPGIVVMLLLLCTLASVVLLLGRFRAARGVARQQYKWVVLTMTLICVTNLADFVARAGGTELYVVTTPLLSLSNALLPVAMGIAILRYRLWDIDIVISRTLVYVTLSACIVGIYILIVGWLGTVFRTGGNLAFSLLATGIVAVLFQPLRERIQRAVNHLLYGERDEPYVVLSRLGRRLEETLAPEAVLPAIAGTVRDALRLPYSAIALTHGDSSVVVAEAGEPVAGAVRLPLVYQHEPIGEMLLGPRVPGEAFSPADRRLLDDLARQAGVAVHAVQLTHELQQARERLVAAREEERRRLRRDLHDGLGSQLAALNLQAGALRSLIDHDPAAAQAEVVEFRAQLRAAIASIRTLVHGLRPPAIDELGLLLALRERARQYGVDGLIVEADLPATLPELPAAVEVAIYRILEEALANVVRHAHASRCLVRLTLDKTIELTIEDDGIGISPTAAFGVGMVSMRERTEELGGSFRVDQRPGGGTRVVACLPVGRDGRDD